MHVRSPFNESPFENAIMFSSEGRSLSQSGPESTMSDPLWLLSAPVGLDSFSKGQGLRVLGRGLAPCSSLSSFSRRPSSRLMMLGCNQIARTNSTILMKEPLSLLPQMIPLGVCTQWGISFLSDKKELVHVGVVPRPCAQRRRICPRSAIGS